MMRKITTEVLKIKLKKTDMIHPVVTTNPFAAAGTVK
jgi:hypothetical protein